MRGFIYFILDAGMFHVEHFAIFCQTRGFETETMKKQELG